jgi:hypothetical protein
LTNPKTCAIIKTQRERNFPQKKGDTTMYLKDQFEIMDTNLTELAEELAFEADMATDPYDDVNWADRMES